MASASIEALVKRAESARATLANYRDRARLSEARIIAGTENIVGGLAGGLLDAKLGEGGEDWQLLGMPGVAVTSAVLALAGASDAVPGGQHLMSIGTGGLAYSLGSLARRKLSEEG